MKYIKRLKIDIDKKNFEVIPSVQYDSNTRFLHIQLLNDSVPFDITGCSVVLSGVKEDGNPIFNSCDIINSEIGFIQAEVTEQMNAIPGYIDCEIKIYDANGVLTSKKFTIKVTASQTSRTVVSTGEFKALTENINKVQNFDNRINTKRDKSVKITKDDLDTSKDSNKIGLNNLSDEVQRAMAGSAPVNPVIPEGGVTSEKYADDSITKNKIAKSGAIQSLNGFNNSSDDVELNTINSKNDLQLKNKSIQELIIGKYSSFYLPSESKFYIKSIGKVNHEYGEIPSNMTKHTSKDKALIINHNINDNPSTSSSNFGYGMIVQNTDNYEGEMTLLVEFKSNISTPTLSMQVYTANDEYNSPGNPITIRRKTINGGLEGEKVNTLRVKFPKATGKPQKEINFCLYTSGAVEEAFKITVSKFLVIKGDHNLASIPSTLADDIIIFNDKFEDKSVELKLNEFPKFFEEIPVEINELKQDINKWNTPFEKALNEYNFVHEGDDWKSNATAGMKSIKNVIAASNFKTLTGRVMEIDYFTDSQPVDGFGYFFRCVNISPNSKQLQIYSRMMLKDYDGDIKTVRMWFRLHKATDSPTHPSYQKYFNIELKNNEPDSHIFILDLPENHEFVECRFGVWNLRATDNEVLVIQHEALGLYENCTAKELKVLPLTHKDITKLGVPIIKDLINSMIEIPSEEKVQVNDCIAPRYIYAVANDTTTNFKTARQYSCAVYLDHMVKTVDSSAKIKEYPNGEGDKFYFVSPILHNGNDIIVNNNENINVSIKSINIESDKYKYPTMNVTQRSTKASISKNQYPKVLFIGDSITAGVGANKTYGNGEYAYWGYVRQFFEWDKIDGGDKSNEYNFKSLGVNSKQTLEIDYKGIKKTIPVSADGFGGWTLANHLHHSSGLRPSQSTWDQLGLGDGSGSDYKGTSEQKMRFALTNENNQASTPANVFFDNNKQGPVKFSIEKWLERYRTCDDDGNKLTMDSPNKGTRITSQSILEQIDVCMPTHVVIQHGRNDFGQVGIEPMLENYKLLIDDLKKSNPNIIIGICLTPDQGGTFFRERYPQILGDIGKINANRAEWNGVKRLMEVFGNMEEQNIYIIPNYFVQPTALGYALQEISMPESLLGVPGYTQNESKRYRALCDYPDSHNGSPSMLTWGYQIYGWLKYIMSK